MGASVQPGGKHVRTVRLRALYDCAEMCGRTATDPGDMRTRAACRCSLPGFDSSTWDPNADRLAAADAQSTLDDLIAVAHHQHVELDHDLDRDGCPWGWVVCRFATSVGAYLGTRGVDSPLRSSSPWLLAKLAQPGPMPTRLLELVDRSTAHEDNAYAYYHQVLAKG